MRGSLYERSCYINGSKEMKRRDEKGGKRKNGKWGIMIVLLIIFMISVGSSFTYEDSGARDYNERVIYSQESVGNIENRALSDPAVIPEHITVMVTFGLGINATSQPITWNVGDFTGLYVPEPKENYQRGINNSWYGSTAVQMYGTSAGVQVHTYSAPEHSSSNLANGQIAYRWLDSDDVRVWTEPTSIMKMGFYLQVPKVYVEGGAVAYSNVILGFKDTVSGGQLWFIVNIYDIRGSSAFFEWVGWDSGTNMPMVATYLGGGTRFAYISEKSNLSTGETWAQWRYFEFLVNRNNFTNAVQAINENYTLSLSTNPSDYIIELLTIQAEIYWPEGSNGHIGVSMRDINLSELYWAVPELSFFHKF